MITHSKISSLMKIFYTLSIILLVSVTAKSQDRSPSTPTGLPVTKIVKFYPNPATSVINFDISKGVDNLYTMQLFNFMGRKVGETVANSEKISFLLDGFYRGVYIYQLRDKSGKIVDSGKFQVVK